MNTSALLFIILIFWIFTLQSKIKHLKKFVYGLKDNDPNVPPHPKQETMPENKVIEYETTNLKETGVSMLLWSRDYTLGIYACV